jgi:hypothetical protein
MPDRERFDEKEKGIIYTGGGNSVMEGNTSVA